MVNLLPKFMINPQQTMWLADLCGDNKQQRMQVIYRLGQDGDETVIPYLSQISRSDPDRSVRVMSRRAICQIKRRKHLE